MLRARAALLFSASSAWLGAQMLTLGVVRLQCGDDAGSAWWPALPLTLTLTLTLFLTPNQVGGATVLRGRRRQRGAAARGSAAAVHARLPAGSVRRLAVRRAPHISLYLDVSRCISLYLPISPSISLCAGSLCAHQA